MLLTALVAVAQAPVVTLDSCRNMALRNNKQLQITNEQQRGASYQRKAARAAYLPSLDATGLYLYNQKEISLLESDQMLPTMSFNPQTGSYGYNLVTGANGQPVMVNGQPVPSQVAVIPKSAMTFDVQNVFEDEDGCMDIDLNAAYYGEVDFRMQYKQIKGRSFDWLYVDFDTLSYYAAENGFKAERIADGSHYDYLARLTMNQ